MEGSGWSGDLDLLRAPDTVEGTVGDPTREDRVADGWR
jgi:hypothetical protein